MEEAVEICKLRLFLKLVAQLDRAESIEPLPDIDFNIRMGNTLIGYVNDQHVTHALLFSAGGQVKILSEADEALKQRIESAVLELQHSLDKFRNAQLDDQDSIDARQKDDVSAQLNH